MIRETKQPTYYEILDVSIDAKPEAIRTAYIRAKNTFARDSLAIYTLFDADDSKRMLAQIEEAYNVLSDEERRRRYDDSHGVMSFPATTESERKNSVTATPANNDSSKQVFGQMDNGPSPTATEGSFAPADSARILSHIERLQAGSSHLAATASRASSNNSEGLGVNDINSFHAPRPYRVIRSFNPDPQIEEKLQAAQDVNGSFLKMAREYKNASFEEMMDLTKISRNYLLAIEEDNVAKLPAAVYVRGFVTQYAKALGLDSQKVATSYMKFYQNRKS